MLRRRVQRSAGTLNHRASLRLSEEVQMGFSSSIDVDLGGLAAPP